MRGVWRFLYISLLHPFSLPSTQPPCEVEGTPHPPLPMVSSILLILNFNLKPSQIQTGQAIQKLDNT